MSELSLAPRQREILTLSARGFTYKAIARHLGISYYTVVAQLWDIRGRLDALSTTNAVAIALTEGLIEFEREENVT